MAKILLARIKSAPPPVARLRLVGTLAQANTGVAYESRLQIVGGGNVLTPAVRTGTRLPIGLSVSIDYGTRELVVSGTALESGAVYTELQVSDEYGQRAVRAVSWLLQVPHLSITGTLLNGAVGYAYASGLSGSGGVGTLVWSLPSAPAWASINPATGVITGTPDATFSSTITVRLTDSLGSFVEATPSLTIGTLWTLAALSPSIHATPDTAVINSGGFASQWNDGSGNGLHFSSGATGRQPQIISSALAGKRGLRFNGALNNTTSQFMFSNSTPAREIFRNVQHGWSVMLYKKTAADVSPTSRSVLRVNANTSATVRMALNCGRGSAGGQNCPAGSFGRLDGGTPVAFGELTPNTDWVILLAYADYQNNVAYFYEDGYLDGTGAIAASGGSTSDTLNLDGVVLCGLYADGSASVGYSDATVMEVAVKGGAALTVDQRDRISASLAWQYGLTANLPSDHPYKLEPPLA